MIGDPRHTFRSAVTPFAGGDQYVTDHEADERFAQSVRRAGGYPRAVTLAGKVALVGADGKAWGKR